MGRSSFDRHDDGVFDFIARVVGNPDEAIHLVVEVLRVFPKPQQESRSTNRFAARYSHWRTRRRYPISADAAGSMRFRRSYR